MGAYQGGIKVRPIKRKPEELRWKGEEWGRVKGVSWEPAPGSYDTELKSKLVDTTGGRSCDPKAPR